MKLWGKDSVLPDTERGKNIQVDFDYVAPSPCYFHIVRALLNFYLDGPDQDKLDCSQFADYILDRASIGSVIASSLGEEDPETNPLYENLTDEEFFFSKFMVCSLTRTFFNRLICKRKN